MSVLATKTGTEELWKDSIPHGQWVVDGESRNKTAPLVRSDQPEWVVVLPLNKRMSWSGNRASLRATIFCIF